LTWTSKSDIRTLKFAFKVGFHDLKTHFNILVLEIVLNTGY